MFRDYAISILKDKIRFGQFTEDTKNIPIHCPFHKQGQEKRPSMYLYVGESVGDTTVTGASFCHTCNEGWSFPSLLKKLGLSRDYIDAAKQLTEEVVPRKRGYSAINFELIELPEAILGAFDYAPIDLLNQGFSKPTLKKYDIGFDRVRKRITFPIRDHRGNLVGISGRHVKKSAVPRYKIYRDELRDIVSNYELNKKRVLWGLDKFYITAMKAGLKTPVVICEGFKAAMWVSQSGYPNTVALMGVHCSKEQRTLISRVTNEVVVFLDNDRAGREATSRLVDFLGVECETRVARYPKEGLNLSPDDLSKTLVQSAIKNSQKRIEWRKCNG